jgi:TetR/AcrR family transcriptional regulator
MTSRAQQGADTRDRIIGAAVEVFTEKGFLAASTREIAKRAGTNQGLITYHFGTKDDLWRAGADRIFAVLGASLGEVLTSLDSGDPGERSREAIRTFVRFAAAHPEFFRMMVDAGKTANERMEWLIDTHIKPHFKQFVDAGAGGINPKLIPHAYYVMAGAASLIFAVAPECQRLTGLDPQARDAIETHAEFVARLLIP